MKKTIILSLLIALGCIISNSIYAQIKLKGTVNDKGTKETLIGTNVVIKGTTTGVTTDLDGNFEIEVDQLPVTLQITYVGYGKQDIEVTDASTPLNISMELTAFAGQEVVISASRVSETIMESAASIQKITAKDIQQAASGDFYQDLGNLMGVDVTSASLGFKIINQRGFNTTSPIRSVQFIDGKDNQAPGLNFPIGNLMGGSELDLESVEIISGAASALYGPNAFQGVISMTSKDPFDYQGLSVMVKGGTRDYIDGQFRYAKVIEFKEFDENAGWLKKALHKRLAFKLTGTYMEAKDWEATDSVANKYGVFGPGEDIEVEIGLDSIVQQLQFDEELTQQERDDFVALNNYLDLVSPGANPGVINIETPGYMESVLANYATRSTKLGVGLAYKLNDSLKISYDYKFGNGTAIYQGTNRYSINNIRFQQHSATLSGRNFFVRGYTTLENAGDSYDIVFTGINLSKSAVPEYVSEYLSAYFDSIAGLKLLTNSFEDEADPWMIDSAHSYAASMAQNVWYKPGTPLFDSAFNAIIDDPDLQSGSKFVDESSLQHIEVQFDLKGLMSDCSHFPYFCKVKFADIIAGASFRRYDPNSYGTIFEDTLVNRNDKIFDETKGIFVNDLNAEYVDISSYEYGAYIQASKRLIDNKLKLTASVRGDKSKNYDFQISPRASAVYTYKNHSFRTAVQSAFRAPTLQNQFLLIDLGKITLSGNLNGWNNLYTLESVDAYNDQFDTAIVSQAQYLQNLQNIDSLLSILEPITLNPIQPEQVKTVEIGYRGIIRNGLYVDLNAYYSRYSSFIGDIRVVQPDGDAVAGEESGENAILNKSFQPYQIPVNAKEKVTTYGGAIGLAYYFGKGFMAKINYTYSLMDTAGLTDPIIPSFNTPKHKFNIGLQGTRVFKELGFSFNYKWIDKFRWESSFGDGDVPSYSLIDMQLNYNFPDYHSTLRIGASNLLRNNHIEAYGSPTIGRMIYASWTFHLDEL